MQQPMYQIVRHGRFFHVQRRLRFLYFSWWSYVGWRDNWNGSFHKEYYYSLEEAQRYIDRQLKKAAQEAQPYITIKYP